MNNFIFYVVLIMIFDLIASISAKMWAMKGDSIYLVSTMIGFALAGLFFAKTLKFEGLAVTNITWIVVSIISVSAVSYFWFDENITGLQFLGIFLALVGMVLVNWE